jgi:uncharacterized protein (TIGR02300 family)
MRVSPVARAPRIRARWEMDLSPGTWAWPLRGPPQRALKALGGGAELALCIRGFKRPLQAGLPVANAPLQQPLLHGKIILVKADLGTKRQCPSCAARFYDLTKRPIECPKCGFSYEPEALFKQRRNRVVEPVAAAGVVNAVESDDEEEDEDEDEAAESEEEEAEAVVEAPLKVAATGEDEDEDAEEEEAEAESGMSVVDADEEVAIEDIEVEDDEDEAENDLLGEVEDEEDDVSGIIDPGIAKDEA